MWTYSWPVSSWMAAITCSVISRRALAGGSLASDAQLAALREKLSGNQN